MRLRLFSALAVILIILMDSAQFVSAAAKILFVPHDDRPISYHQTAEVIEQLGYEVLMPPKELLGLEGADTHPDEIWNWLERNAPSAKIAVIAADSVFYGGLIPSRKHEISAEILNRRVDRFKNLREINHGLNIYVFGSLMRTPYIGTKGDIEEPDYYAEFGDKIHRYTALVDKAEISALTAAELASLHSLRNSLPSDILNDWLGRRTKNLAVTKKLIELTKTGTINYLVIGRDDNTPLSQTHMENRQLLACAAENNLDRNKFQSLAGIDEFNLLLMTRAINEIRGDRPKIFVRYSKGVGGDTVPAFSNEAVKDSIVDEVVIAGGRVVDKPSGADLILLVNTDANGETRWEHNAPPSGKIYTPNLTPDAGTKYFAGLVEDYIDAGCPVGIADIKFANGADNALMKILHDNNLLFKINSYAGWNTATNSTGFALATGILARHMTPAAKNKLLARRYLDDWAYQANIRAIVGEKLYYTARGTATYYQFDGEREAVEAEETELMREFARKNLPPFKFLSGLKVTNPWNRMFECEIEFGGDDE